MIYHRDLTRLSHNQKTTTDFTDKTDKNVLQVFLIRFIREIRGQFFDL